MMWQWLLAIPAALVISALMLCGFYTAAALLDQAVTSTTRLIQRMGTYRGRSGGQQ